MPKFIEFQQKAIKLAQRLTGSSNGHQIVCTTFFHPIMLDKKVVQDAHLISKVASCLDHTHDDNLIYFLQDQKEHSLLTMDEFIEFKTKALIGCYLLKWSQYGGVITHYIYKPLIEFFQKDLDISAFSDLTIDFVDSCLETFEHFCAFLNQNKSNPVYTDVHNHLGDSIQLEIYQVRYPTSTASIIYGVVKAGMHSIGIQ